MPNIDYANRKPKAINYGEKLQVRIDKNMQERLHRAKEELGEDIATIVRQALDIYLNTLLKSK